MTQLGWTDLEVFPLSVGGSVFGWTADERQSFAVLDAYAAAGGNFIDTADVYSSWVAGNSGGESETIVGRWLAARRRRGQMVIATKVGQAPTVKGLAADTIRAAADASLKRLGTDYIDLYYAHVDDQSTPLEETLSAFDGLVRQGKVRYIAASNYTAPRLAEALAVSKREGLSRYAVLQPHFNLVHRAEYEGDLANLCRKEAVSCVPYCSLAQGFLTGKYRMATNPESRRGAEVWKYLDARGLRVLNVLDEIALLYSAPAAAVSLAWLLAQPNVEAVIASARTPEQLADLIPATALGLTCDEVRRLSEASSCGGIVLANSSAWLLRDS